MIRTPPVDVDEDGIPAGVKFLDAPADINETAPGRIAERLADANTASIKVALAGHAVRLAV